MQWMAGLNPTYCLYSYNTDPRGGAIDFIDKERPIHIGWLEMTSSSRGPLRRKYPSMDARDIIDQRIVYLATQSVA